MALIIAAQACLPLLHLPDLDGSEVASKLRRLGLERLPIVALGKPGNERGVALAAGCDATIPSPPDLALLPGQVREFLSGKRDKLPAEDERRYLRVLAQSLVEKLEAKAGELTATNERLQRVDELKSELMQSISHELSTPLTPLAGYLKILQSEKLGALSGEQLSTLARTDELELLYLHLYSMRNFHSVKDRLLETLPLQAGETAAADAADS